MRAAGYIRLSSEEQAREGYGLAAQEQAVRAYCQAQGWELLELYADAGRSGGSMRRREDLMRLLEDAQGGRFQRLVFWRLDRLARNLRDLLAICDRLEALDVGSVSFTSLSWRCGLRPDRSALAPSIPCLASRGGTSGGSEASL